VSGSALGEKTKASMKMEKKSDAESVAQLDANLAAVLAALKVVWMADSWVAMKALS